MADQPTDQPTDRQPGRAHREVSSLIRTRVLKLSKYKLELTARTKKMIEMGDKGMNFHHTKFRAIF